MNETPEEFARRFFRESMSQNQIRDFGPDDPPPPEYEIPVSRILAEPDLEPAPAPFVPRPPAPPPPPDPEMLAILGHQAAFKGQAFELSQEEHDAIGQIILNGALARVRSMLDGLQPKPPVAIAPTEPIKRKRGRPRKVPLVG